jgi:hypothetical protein
MAARWTALPTWWVRQLRLGAFTGGNQAGRSIAAVKVLLALSLLADFRTRQVKCSLSGLEALTGLSRPMVITGTAALEGMEILKVDRSGHVNEYELVVTDEDKNWGKLPYELLRKHLPEIVNRGAITLAALKIYLLLVSWRPNQSLSIAISHDKIREETGIQTRHVRPALDVLINHTLIRLSVSEGATPGETKGRHNVYTLLGLTV